MDIVFKVKIVNLNKMFNSVNFTKKQKFMQNTCYYSNTVKCSVNQKVFWQ